MDFCRGPVVDSGGLFRLIPVPDFKACTRAIRRHTKRGVNLNGLQLTSLAYEKVINLFKGSRGQRYEQIRNFESIGVGGSDRP